MADFRFWHSEQEQGATLLYVVLKVERDEANAQRPGEFGRSESNSASYHMRTCFRSSVVRTIWFSTQLGAQRW